MTTVYEDINHKYENFYLQRAHSNVYPNEFVVRTFLSSYPKLSLPKVSKGQRILDVGFGDGRNTKFLCELGLDVSGIEITGKVVEQAKKRMNSLGYFPDLQVGRNSDIPYQNKTFDYILSCHCCYYCDEGQTLHDNLVEYNRVLKKGGYLITSVANKSSYIFSKSKPLSDGSFLISEDPYNNRQGYRLFGFASYKEIQDYFSDFFHDFSFGVANNNYYGIDEKFFGLYVKRNSR